MLQVKVLTLEKEMTYMRKKEEVTNQETIYTDLKENQTTVKDTQKQNKCLIPETKFDCLLCHNIFKDNKELLEHWRIVYFCKDFEKCFNEDDKNEDNKNKKYSKVDLHKCQDCVSILEGVADCDDPIQNNHPTTYMEMTELLGY